jgi:hypothetical protein
MARTPEQQEAERLRQQKRRESGLCSSCNRQAVPGRTRCEVHLAKSAEQTRTRNARTQTLGVCSRCKKRPSRDGKKYCADCLKYCNSKTKAAYQADHTKQKEASARWYNVQKARKKCPQCHERDAVEGNVCCEECQQYHRDKGKLRQAERKRIVLAHYGTTCKCCGLEKAPEFLQVDHVDGGGRQHLKEIGQSRLYAWLIQNNFPTGFQVLCAECNFAWGHSDCCPHARTRLVVETRAGETVMVDPLTKKVARNVAATDGSNHGA